MRSGGLELTVLGADGQPFPELTLDGETHVVARVGEEFQIRVGVDSSWGHEVHQVCIEIDGQSLNYSKLLKQGNLTSRCEGFMDGSHYRAFVFNSLLTQNTTEDVSILQQTVKKNELGTIKATYWSAYATGTRHDTRGAVYNGASRTNASGASKKFWENGAVSIGAGTAKGSASYSSTIYQKDQHLGELKIRYSDFVSLLVRKAIVPVALKNLPCIPDSELNSPGITMEVLKGIIQTHAPNTLGELEAKFEQLTRRRYKDMQKKPLQEFLEENATEGFSVDTTGKPLYDPRRALVAVKNERGPPRRSASTTQYTTVQQGGKDVILLD